MNDYCRTCDRNNPDENAELRARVASLEQALADIARSYSEDDLAWALATQALEAGGDASSLRFGGEAAITRPLPASDSSAASVSGPEPAKEACHICGHPRDEPGEIYCSAGHPTAREVQPASVPADTETSNE